ncbi:hypothetical protein LTR56_020563 [Elasticomyces elasticus]|nr:hypothetical protein LTR56_020563 [Elasticomyces elasticus]KAK3655829.1 hypothetical protein LTR22_010124 [Elasticomyces elasticus]KAK5764785.1 hypothetical protein LTS12_005054 [Elasticomyces elasticus]
MASSPLINTPTDVMYMIFDLLEVWWDLHRFRLVCRWAQEESHEYFATHAYRRIRISSDWGSMAPTQRAEKAFRGNSALAARVRTLSVHWNPHPFDTHWFTTKEYYSYDSVTTNHSSVVSSLSKLKRLELGGMTSLYLERFFQLQSNSSDCESLNFNALGADWPRLEALKIKDAYLTYEELMAVIRRAGPTLTSLHLQDINLSDGQWHVTLRAIQSMVGSLETMTLKKLYDRKHWYRGQPACSFTCRDEDIPTLQKPGRDDSGAVGLSMMRYEASMIGEDAIRAGLDIMSKHAAETQDTN